MVADAVIADTEELTGRWGWFLAAGIAWVVFGFVVLSFNQASVWAIAVFFGIGFIAGGVMELVLAAIAPGWKWLYALIGIISILAGFMALIWPGETFLVLAAIVALAAPLLRHHRHRLCDRHRHIDDLWWLQLIGGVAMVLLGLWAISPDNSTVSTWRTTVLLVFWVGIAALIRGISDIVLAFRLRSAHKQVQQLA